MAKFDFSGWATKNNLKCSDGRIIMKDAFKHNDGEKVPLVWNHEYNGPDRILGHAMLENREEGVYAYGTFNDTEAGQTAKLLVQHKDIDSMSIFANQLQQQGPNVIHGSIKEVSLVLAAANPGAYIETVMKHGEECDEEAQIFTGEELMLIHSEVVEETKEEPEEEELEHSEKDETVEDENETIADVLETLTDKQKKVVYALYGEALESSNKPEEGNDKKEKEDPKGGNNTMKHNVFEGQDPATQENTLTHSQMETIINDAKRYGSLKESFLAHAADYGIDNIEYLLPDARALNNQPEFIKRDTGWVGKVMSGTHHTPFSRIKSLFADITADDARAKGYIKGNLKKEEVFTLLKRTTAPTTVYKKQKLDRDDVSDITDLDVIAWLKTEMRMMLDEEIARAVLIGDGRLASSDDKIKEDCIRPIWKDEALFTINHPIQLTAGMAADKIASEFIDGTVRAMKDYKGSGTPTCFTTEEMLTECLLLKDVNGRRIYKNVDEIATAMRVKEIITVPVMEGCTRQNSSSKTCTLKAIIVNLNDYNIGAEKGGAINMFDDFDIDYNQQKYLIETRCSGALVKPFSAIAIETVSA